MASHVRWGRVFRIAGIAVLTPIVCLAAYVPIQQRILRWRAERLLADIRQIQMGKSTWADAQRLMYRWAKWNVSWDGPGCSAQYCRYAISLNDASHALHGFPLIDGGQWESKPRWPSWVNRPYSWAGGRFAVVRAEFEVRNGLIWSKSFAVLTMPFPLTYDENGEMVAASKSSVVASAVSETRNFHGQWLSKPVVFSVNSPEISVWVSDDRDGHGAVVTFTPFAGQRTENALLDFNLDCLARWKECRTAREMMPTAAYLYQSGLKETDQNRDPNFLRALPLWIAARDAEDVVIAKALNAPSHSPLKAHSTRLSLRIIKLLKGDSSIPGRNVYMIKTVGAEENCPISPADAHVFPPGTQLLLIFSGEINEESTPEADLSPCVVAPITNQNLADVRRGIARDSVLRDAVTTSP